MRVSSTDEFAQPKKAAPDGWEMELGGDKRWFRNEGAEGFTEELTPARNSAPLSPSPPSESGLALSPGLLGNKDTPVLGLKAACGSEGWEFKNEQGWDGVEWLLHWESFELDQNW